MKTRALLLIAAFCLLLSAFTQAAGFGQSLAFKANAGKPPVAAGAPCGTNPCLDINDVSGTSGGTAWAGYTFTLGTSNVTVCQLKRLALPGNSEVHKLVIVSASGIVATNVVNMSGVTTGTYATVDISPVVLTALTTYAILGQTDGTDVGIDHKDETAGTFITAFQAAFKSGAVPANLSEVSLNGVGKIYGAPNFNIQ